MKKNVICISLLVVSLITLVIYTNRTNATRDSEPPKITCPTDKIHASVSEISDEFLLKDVTAYDNSCGDVSDSLVVQSISNFINENVVIVTYAAVDDSNNVGRLERKLIYTDYKEPVFNLSKPLMYAVGTNVKFLGNISASSSIDGDLTNQIRYGLDTIVDNNTPSNYPITFRVTDTNGKTSYLETEIVIYNSLFTGINIYLTDYLIYIPKGTEFTEETARSYFKSASEELDDETKLSIDCQVDTSKAGVYNVDYTVTSVNTGGKSRLVVVVTED